MKKLIAIAALVCAFAAEARPESHERPPERRHKDKESECHSRVWLPLGLSILTPPIQIPSPSHTVIGGMINLGYGQMDSIAILDVGLINNVTHVMTGAELGPANLAGTCVGAQAGALNITGTTVGLQLGILNFTGDLHGVQLGLLNFSASGGAWIFPIFNLGL